MELSQHIDTAAMYLKAGHLVAIPTETVYGLAANALNKDAVQKIFEVKKRPLYNPLILHVAYKSEVLKYAKNVPSVFSELMDLYWPGPITFLLEKNESVSDLITGGSSKVAVRIPNHPLSLALLRSLDFPLVAPSANQFQSISPTKAEHVAQQFSDDDLALILDGGPCTTGIESTVVGFENDQIVIYRHGAITKEMLQKVWPNVITHTHNERNPQAPGMLGLHYSPKTPLYIFKDINALQHATIKSNSGMISYVPLTSKIAEHQIVLSANASMEEAAKNLYDALYQMDQKKIEAIYTHLLDGEGLAVAINDKLLRAGTLL